MRSTLFIALSGFAHRSQVEKKADYFDHYFIKPVDMRTLLASLSKHARNGPESEPGKKPPRPEMAESSGRPRVLLVEDQPFVAEATAALLRMEELEVRTVLSGREALEVAPDFRPQLILCDMRLGDMKGTEVIRELRSNPLTKQAHAVIVTAFSESEIEEFNQQAKEFGVNEFVSKPVDFDMIQRLVSTLRPH